MAYGQGTLRLSSIEEKPAGGKQGSFPAQMLSAMAVLVAGCVWSRDPGMDLKMFLASCLLVLREVGAGQLGADSVPRTPRRPVKGERDGWWAVPKDMMQGTVASHLQCHGPRGTDSRQPLGTELSSFIRQLLPLALISCRQVRKRGQMPDS